MNPHNALAPVGIKPQTRPWTRNSVSDPAASGEVFDTNKSKIMKGNIWTKTLISFILVVYLLLDLSHNLKITA